MAHVGMFPTGPDVYNFVKDRLGTWSDSQLIISYSCICRILWQTGRIMTRPDFRLKSFSRRLRMNWPGHRVMLDRKPCRKSWLLKRYDMLIHSKSVWTLCLHMPHAIMTIMAFYKYIVLSWPAMILVMGPIFIFCYDVRHKKEEVSKPVGLLRRRWNLFFKNWGQQALPDFWFYIWT